MTRLQRTLICLTLIAMVPTAVAVGWWYYYPHLSMNQQENAVAENRLVEAEDLVTKLLQDDPNNLRAQLLYVQVLRRQNRPVEAQTVLLQAMKLGLPAAEGRREFALAEAIKKFTPNAGKNLLQVLHERPADADVLPTLARGYAEPNRSTEAN